jgi:O-methyltransferase
MLKRLINSALGSVGYQISRLHSDVARISVESIGEVEALCRQTMFQALYPREDRAVFLSRLIGTSLVEALFLLNELSQTLSLEGDVCEFGIAQGATSALMANEIRNTSKTLWLFDSFEGLPRPTEKDKLIDDIFSLGSIEKYHGQMAIKQSNVVSRLKSSGLDLDRCRFVPGFIEETSQKASLPQRVCFAYVDFDFYEPILIALRLLAPRLPIGGRIVIDDYGFFSTGAQSAVEEFLQEMNGSFDRRLPPSGAGHFAMMTRLR